MVAYAYFKLVRFPILLLIAAIQYSTREFVIKPMLAINGFELQTSNWQFFLIVMSSVLIAAGGYAINDYFDAKIDRINKPRLVVLDRIVKRRIAMALHLVLTSLGFILAAYVSYDLGMWRLNTIFLFIVFALWFYSTNLKHVFLAGNLVIGLLAGLVPLIVGFFEIPLQNQAHPEIIEELGFSIFNIPAFWIIGYSVLFALLTLVREITKDIIDLRGDKAYGSKTIPATLGLKSTKTILIGLYIMLIVLLGFVYMEFLSVHSNLLKSALFITEALLVAQIAIIFTAKTKPRFRFSANLNIATVILVVVSMYLLKHSIESYFV